MDFRRGSGLMENLAIKINECIKNSEIYKSYIKCKNSLESNAELVNIKNNMELLKKEICKDKNNNLTEEYYILEKKYKDNVLVKEYERCKAELSCLLSDISDILSLK